jgi:hypothetical protein
MPLGDALTAFLYDRKVSLQRQTETYPSTGRAQIAVAPVVGASSVAASIQMARSHVTGLSTDDTTSPRWAIYLDPAFTLPLMVNDLVTDDLGRTFKVLSPYPSPLGYKLECQDWTTGGAHGG